MPNTLAYLSLVGWPLIAFAMFRVMPFERALIWSILGAYLLLPPGIGFDAPLVPPLTKTSIPNLAALLICLFVMQKPVSPFPRSPIGRVLVICFVVSPVATVLTNADPIRFAHGGIPGLSLYDSLSAVINQGLFVLAFFLGRQFLGTPEAQRELIRALFVAGLIYSVPMLLEVRLSPQFNVWIYGYFPHSFAQQVRFGGFRPVVFLAHGLWVAFFALTTLVAAAALWRRAEAASRSAMLAGVGYLALVLFLCKSVASMVYAVLLLPLVMFFNQRMQLRIAAALGVIAVLYPLLRGADLVPTEFFVSTAAENIDTDRAASLQFRFDNEDVLLSHANEKPLFGWGGWGRNRVYDPETGQDITTTDGRWVIVIGQYGWLGYMAEFGLLALPLVLLWRHARTRGLDEVAPYLGPLALILAINMVDLLPNASLIPFTWLLAGALLGYAEAPARRSVPGEATRPETMIRPFQPAKQTLERVRPARSRRTLL